MTTSNINVDRQEQVLRSFPEPKDLLQRSYFQYVCQMKNQSSILTTIQNITALALLPIYFIILALGRSDKPQQATQNCAVFFCREGLDVTVLPECLKDEYSQIISCNYAEKMNIGKQECLFLAKLFAKYWYAPYFIFKCMLKIGMYNEQIIRFNPKAIIACNEYSYTSSVLTEYCSLRGLEHINVMHGEKYYNNRDSFVQYNRYYVWDEYYVNLLVDLRADKKQFRIALPGNMKLECISDEKPIYDYTYYLSYERTAQLLKIKQALLRTGADRSKICVRCHPRYSDADKVKRIFEEFIIEEPRKVTINESLSRTKSVASKDSTTLYQAYKCGKPVIIDDVTDILKYNKLREVRYIMLEKKHIKLSELISKGIKNDFKV